MPKQTTFRMTYVAVGLILLFTACASFTTGGNQQDETNLSDRASRGETIFARKCASCHATTTETIYGPGLADLFSDERQSSNDRLPNGEPITEESVAEWIRNGGEGQIGIMPPQNLTEQEMADVIAYLKTLKR